MLWFQNLRPPVARTFEEFVTYVEVTKAESVTGTSIKVMNHSHATAQRENPNYSYAGEFKATTPEGRIINYREDYIIPEYSQGGSPTSALQGYNRRRTVYTVYLRLKWLKKKFPGLTITLVTFTGTYDEARLNRLEYEQLITPAELLPVKPHKSS